MRGKQRSKPAEQPQPSQAIPVVEERVTVKPRVRTTGRVRISKSTEQRSVLVDETFVTEEFEIIRKPRNQVVDRAQSIRQEGDSIVIPVHEQRAFTETKLVLIEELHVVKRR